MRLRRLFIIASILLFSACASHRADQAKQRAALHMQIGSSLLEAGKYPEALAELMRAERLDSSNPAVHNYLGLAYSIRGRPKEAELHYIKAIELNAGYSDARSNLARLQIDQKKYDQAIKNLSVVENDLTYASPEKALTLMGMAYFEQGKWRKAEEYLARAMNVRRDSCITSVFYGRALFEGKKLDEAAGILDLAVENCRSAKYEEPLFFSAMTYYSLGEKEKSKARLEELISGYPRSRYITKAKGLMGLLE